MGVNKLIMPCARVETKLSEAHVGSQRRNWITGVISEHLLLNCSVCLGWSRQEREDCSLYCYYVSIFVDSWY